MLLFLLIYTNYVEYFDGLVQECSYSNALAMELLQSCIKPSICVLVFGILEPKAQYSGVPINSGVRYNRVGWHISQNH